MASNSVPAKRGNVREVATVMAALRLWQSIPNRAQLAQSSIADNLGTITPLDVEEIDAFCEDLNFGDLEIVRISGNAA